MSDVTYRRRADGGKRRKHLDETNITGVLAERRTRDGRRRLKLTKDERAMFSRQQLVERAVSLFLDLENDHSWEEIARELGISVMALKDLTKTEEFIAAYDAHFAELGQDPRSKSARAALTDMLPLAVRQLRSLLASAGTPPTVKMKAIEKVLELNGIGPAKEGIMDRNELMNFLREANISITQNNINTAPLPQDYQENISAYVDGRWKDIDAHESGAVAMNEFPAQETDDEEFTE